jgi:Transcription factor WhiB
MASLVLPGGRRRLPADADGELELAAVRSVHGSLPCEADPDLWYVEESFITEVDRAKAGCRACPGRAACLRLAMERDERHGIWGGLTASERGYRRGGARVSLPAGLIPAVTGTELAVASA